MNDLESATAVEEAFRGNGISVGSASLDDAVSLTYLAAFPDVKPDRGEMDHVVTPFLGHARGDEFGLRAVGVTVLRSEGDVQATWMFEVDQIRVYNNYTLDNEELSQHVLDSLYEEDSA